MNFAKFYKTPPVAASETPIKTKSLHIGKSREIAKSNPNKNKYNAKLKIESKQKQIQRKVKNFEDF